LIDKFGFIASHIYAKLITTLYLIQCATNPCYTPNPRSGTNDAVLCNGRLTWIYIPVLWKLYKTI